MLLVHGDNICGWIIVLENSVIEYLHLLKEGYLEVKAGSLAQSDTGSVKINPYLKICHLLRGPVPNYHTDGIPELEYYSLFRFAHCEKSPQHNHKKEECRYAVKHVFQASHSPPPTRL